MLPKRKSALVLPVKRSSTESCSDILDLRAEYKKFKTHPHDATSPVHFTDDVNSISIQYTSGQNSSRLIKDEGLSPPLNGPKSHVLARGAVRCCGGCSESFASFHQMFSHLNSASHSKTPLNLSRVERPYFDEVSHLPAPPDSVSFSSTPSALERLVNSSLFQTTPQNPPDLSDDTTHRLKLVEKTQSFLNDFQTAEDVANGTDVTNEIDVTSKIAPSEKMGILRSSVVMNNNIVVNEETEKIAEGVKFTSFTTNRPKTSRNLSRSSNVASSHSVESPLKSELLSSSNDAEKLSKPYKGRGNKTNPWSTNQNLRQHKPRSHLPQQTQQNFLQNYLQPVFCQSLEVQNLMDLFYQNEIQKLMQQSFVDPKLFFLLSNQARFPWIQPAYPSNAFTCNASSCNLPANGSNFQNIPGVETNSVSGDCNPPSIDSQSKGQSCSWSEKAKSNVWLMMGHGNTCFACGRSFTSKGSFRYHLSRCHILSGINTR